jgi:serine/threonine protein kinase
VYRGEPVAAKQVAVGRGAAPLRALLEEAQRMAALRHPHLVTFYGVSLDGGRGSGALVMELCEGGWRGAGWRVVCV